MAKKIHINIYSRGSLKLSLNFIFRMILVRIGYQMVTTSLPNKEGRMCCAEIVGLFHLISANSCKICKANFQQFNKITEIIAIDRETEIQHAN